MPPYLDFLLFNDTGLLADIFNGSSGFNRLNHGGDRLLSKTGFTYNDLLRWQSLTTYQRLADHRPDKTR
ncbi:hypothetical protein GM30_19535 [Trabulsiella odontotermitis]|nr:hypothetical protein GM30_19535 [Trabulsiella odontotermitis]